MKKAIVLGIIIVSVGSSYFYPHAMLNPGDLIKAHHDINDKCLSCHKPFSGISNEKCISCHKLSEIGKDTMKIKDTSGTKKKILFHQQLSNQECSSCHTDHKGINYGMAMSNFKHEFLSESIISKCAGCHEKPIDNIHKSLASSCAGCHNTGGWKSSVAFDHNMISGTDKNNCASCHQKPGDVFHSLLKENCSKCHGTSKWIPSSFDHSSYFQLDRNYNAACNTCHANNNYNTYSCYGCHEHSENNIISKHTEEGIYNISNCASCHKSGNEHDIKMEGERKNRTDQKEINNAKDYIRPEKKGEKKDND